MTRELTDRQAEVLRLAADGHTPLQIARILGLAQATITGHLARAERKLTPPAPQPTPPQQPVDPLLAIATEAGRRQLTPAEAGYLAGAIRAFRATQTENRQLRDRATDYEQVIASQRVELLKTRASLAGTAAALRRSEARHALP